MVGWPLEEDYIYKFAIDLISFTKNILPDQSGPTTAQIRRPIIVQPQRGTLSQRQHRMFDVVQELHDAILARFTLMLTVRIGVNEMRIYVDRNDAQRFERRRIRNRHVVGRVDRRRGDIRAGTASDVGQLAGMHTTSDRFNELSLVQIR